MSPLSFTRIAFGALPAVAFLSGCGNAGILGNTSSVAVLAQHRPPARPWIDPSASGGDLVYATTSSNNAVNVYTYPGGKQVGTLTGFNAIAGLCSDTSGNVWVINQGSSSSRSSTILKYAHGGSKPIASLLLSDYGPDACAVDPSSGNLAVGTMGANLAIWTDGQGSPTFYSTLPFISEARTLTYDGSGNLYAKSFRGAKKSVWLPKGASTVMQSHILANGPYGWDGAYLVVHSVKKRGLFLRRFKLDGGSGQAIGNVTLSGCGPSFSFSTEGSELAISCQGNEIAYYNYPAGGSPIATVPVGRAVNVVISVGSHR